MKKNNRRKSKIRCRIEHVFAYMTMSMHGLTVRSMGIERAVFNIGLTNLVYNLCHYSFLSQKKATVEDNCTLLRETPAILGLPTP